MRSSLTALSKRFQTGVINFPRIVPNVVKTKTKLQQLFNEDKAKELLKEDIRKKIGTVQFSSEVQQYYRKVCKGHDMEYGRMVSMQRRKHP